MMLIWQKKEIKFDCVKTQAHKDITMQDKSTHSSDFFFKKGLQKVKLNEMHGQANIDKYIVIIILHIILKKQII